MNYETDRIISMKEERPFAWNIIFTVKGSEMQYATDVVLAAKRESWVANTFITHNLSSLMNVKECSFCNEKKIACDVLCRHHEEVVRSMTAHEDFQRHIIADYPELAEKGLPSELMIEARKKVWDELLYENFTYKLSLKK